MREIITANRLNQKYNSDIELTLIDPENTFLKQCIENIWVLESKKTETFCYNMLPGSSIDLILIFSYEDTYSGNKRKVQLKDVFLCGVNDRYYSLNFNHKMLIIGFQFIPGISYSFLKIPLKEIPGIINFDSIIHGFSLLLKEKLAGIYTYREIIPIIGNELVKRIDPDLFSSPAISSAALFLGATNRSIITCCSELGINRRKLERQFSTFIGISPKKYQKITRIQKVIINMITHKNPDLTEWTYAFGYYDQPHFIRDFNEFTGLSPGKFFHKEILCSKINNHISAVDIFTP